MRRGAPAKIPVRDLPERVGAEFRGIALLLGAVGDSAAPSIVERQWLWDGIFREFEAGLAEGQPEKPWKRRILAMLAVHAPGLGRSPAALRRTWDRGFADWSKSGRKIEALRDGRSQSRRAFGVPEADRDAITAAALFETGNRLAAAWRLVKRRGQLSQETAERFTAEPSRKTYVPAAVRREVSPLLPALGAYHRGPKAGKLAGAFITRDWSKAFAGDWYQADDVTLPVYYSVPEGDWHRLTRGQCLVMIDLRSRRILDFVLIDEKSYDSFRIRRLMNRVCDRFGLPRRGFYFEGGIWERSKLVTGGDQPSAPGVAEVVTGFGALGLEFMHARTPRAKPIERVLGMVQDLMESEAGYAGRNEIVDRFERLHLAKLDVESRRRHPSEVGFRSADDWFARLHSIFEEYNRTPQEGGGTLGLSPDDAWERYQAKDNPLVKLPPEARHLLATHRSRKRVSKNGVKITVGKRSFIYRNDATGRLRGQEVLVWFDPECPAFCTLTTEGGDRPLVVPLAPAVAAVDATPDELAAAAASVMGHEAPIRERYSSLRATFLPAIRANLVSPSVQARGREMASQRVAMETATRDRAHTADSLCRGGLSRLIPGAGAEALARDAAGDPERAAALSRLSKLLTNEQGGGGQTNE